MHPGKFQLKKYLSLFAVVAFACIIIGCPPREPGTDEGAIWLIFLLVGLVFLVMTGIVALIVYAAGRAINNNHKGNLIFTFLGCVIGVILFTGIDFVLIDLLIFRSLTDYWMALSGIGMVLGGIVGYAFSGKKKSQATDLETTENGEHEF